MNTPELSISYLKGHYHQNKRTACDLEKAIVHFRRAIASDPTHALAYAGLAVLQLAGFSRIRRTAPTGTHGESRGGHGVRN